MNKYLDVTKEQYKSFMELPINEPLFMLNLLQFKKVVEEENISGKEQYKKYLKATQPFFEKANAEIIFYGNPQFTLIGPNDEWDKVLIVKYKNKEDFINMISTKGYPSEMRKKAIIDSRLIFCSSNIK